VLVLLLIFYFCNSKFWWPESARFGENCSHFCDFCKLVIIPFTWFLHARLLILVTSQNPHFRFSVVLAALLVSALVSMAVTHYTTSHTSSILLLDLMYLLFLQISI